MISIIICTRNRGDNLAQTLESFKGVAVPAGLGAEILVVDNGSTDHTAAVVRNQSLANIPLRCILETSPGQSRARNAGIAASSSEFILFTDDDVAPAKDWLQNLAAPLLQGKCEAVAGRVDLAQERCRPWMTPQHLVWLAAFHGERRQLVGANMGFHRSVLDRVPEFDPELGPGALGFADETLFSWQLLEAGFQMRYVPEASVVHFPERSRLVRSSWLSTGRKHGASLAYLLHHWHHESVPAPRLRYYYVALKLRLRRLLAPPKPLETEGTPPWEMSYVVEMEKCRQFLKERTRPRNYSKRGLRKLGQSAQHCVVGSH
jgi:glucosyl-dolichyl phosphate glucuronosyltransferase